MLSIANILPLTSYKLLDTGHRQRLEQFASVRLSRPDPTCLWQPSLPKQQWQDVHAHFSKQNDGRERWQIVKNLPAPWTMSLDHVTWQCKLSPFKHTGVFPEQSWQWQWIHNAIKTSPKPIKLLNLFAYTGIHSLFASHAGAQVTHVDASKPTIGWARENQKLSNLDQHPIRWIEDDCLKFVQRELRRGNKYDAIIMDPPVYGHGPSGKSWDLMRDLPELLGHCKRILSTQPSFILINAYAISISHLTLQNIVQDTFPKFSNIHSGELSIVENNQRRYTLSTGIYCLAQAKLDVHLPTD
jgi:23S rRNA (cytosine1962-C5)-methyltransferase